MKNLFLLSTAAAITLFAFSANAATNVTGQANAKATIVQPLTVYNNTSDTGTAGEAQSGQELNFGTVVGEEQTVAVSASASPTRTGTNVIESSTFKAAPFTVKGAAGTSFTFSVPASAEITSGSNKMTVDTFTASATGQQTIAAGGKNTIYVGGTLHVNEGQAAGDYSGPFTVTVSY